MDPGSVGGAVHHLLRAKIGTTDSVDAIAQRLLEMPLHIDPIFVNTMAERILRSWDLDKQQCVFMCLSEIFSSNFTGFVR